MAAVLKRLLTICLALAFLTGVTAQLVPSSMAETSASASAGIAGCCDEPQPPCTGHLPNCLDHGGCISISVLLTSPTAVAAPVEWTSLDYDLAPQALSGTSIEPELSPPIFMA